MIKRSSRPKGRELLEGVDDLLYGERPCPHPSRRPPPHFNSRSPCGERPNGDNAVKAALLFQPTLPVRGATGSPQTYGVSSGISTHAPRAGSDMATNGMAPKQLDFNPRSPCGERRIIPISVAVPSTFQPTLPVRGATLIAVFLRPPGHISTHAPRAGSDDRDVGVKFGRCISTHAPRAGSDRSPGSLSIFHFISTHAPRAGSDSLPGMDNDRYADFNPRSPCGERLYIAGTKERRFKISTHAPRAGSDGRRTCGSMGGWISTHAPRAGSDTTTQQMIEAQRISTHAPRAGSDLVC